MRPSGSAEFSGCLFKVTQNRLEEAEKVHRAIDLSAENLSFEIQFFVSGPSTQCLLKWTYAGERIVNPKNGS
jgi:hypothetical protein